MYDAAPAGDPSARRQQWEAYIRRTFDQDPEQREPITESAPAETAAPEEGCFLPHLAIPGPFSASTAPPRVKPPSEPLPGPSHLGIRPGAILAMPLRAELDSLPPGFYVLLTDPQLPVVTLCLAGRDAEGYLCATDNRIHIRRELMELFQPVAGLRLY